MALNGYNFLLGLAMSSILVANSTHAEIILHGTRVIYPSDAREVTLQVSNNGSKPSLVQAWIDEGDAKSTPDQSKVPFMITPPISRVDPTKSQSLRITALPNAAQIDQKKETVYCSLNENSDQIASLVYQNLHLNVLHQVILLQ